MEERISELEYKLTGIIQSEEQKEKEEHLRNWWDTLGISTYV